MKRRLTAVLSLALLALAACSEKKAPTPPTPPPDRPKAAQPAPVAAPSNPHGEVASLFADDAAVITQLRAGGYVIALRHTRTDMNQKDYEKLEDYTDCTKQRNLTAEGRDDAKKLGEWFRAINIPVADVLSSPFCRNRETAELAFGKFTINKGCMGEDEGSIAARAALLATIPPAGSNVVLVTHKHSMGKSIGDAAVDLFNEGGAVIVKPMGDSKYEIMHVISFEDWARLAEAAKTLK